MKAMPFIAVLVAGVLTALGGCSRGNNFADIQAFMDEVDSRPKGTIDPLPPFEQVPPYAYRASNRRSPFEPPVVLKRVVRDNGGVQVTPDFNRTKQFLEQFTIAQLSMVGTLAQGQRHFGLVKDGDGGVHRVQAGDYLGSDHGQIQSVDDVAIELIEIVPDGAGGWVERARTVSL
ncbi:MAG: pilus assembly protein PilP [Gammaproteobacteria bacterium]|nr:pilus assembly protein PilP [Gammaproteobacteria bacterium]